MASFRFALEAYLMDETEFCVRVESFFGLKLKSNTHKRRHDDSLFIRLCGR